MMEKMCRYKIGSKGAVHQRVCNGTYRHEAV